MALQAFLKQKNMQLLSCQCYIGWFLIVTLIMVPNKQIFQLTFGTPPHTLTFRDTSTGPHAGELRPRVKVSKHGDFSCLLFPLVNKGIFYPLRRRGASWGQRRHPSVSFNLHIFQTGWEMGILFNEHLAAHIAVEIGRLPSKEQIS